jgi:broad specificity phosphatase PhoE
MKASLNLLRSTFEALLPGIRPRPSLRLAGPMLSVVLLCASFTTASARAAATAEDAWAALRNGGVVVLLRHAQTVPGVGDPPGFRLDDCGTQRNLSDAGRQQARRLGEAFKAAGVPVGEILSSRWCRCIDTASEAFGRVTGWPTADSFFDARLSGAGANARQVQTEALRKRIAAHRGKETLVVVTHQVNITELTGVHPAMGELVVVRPAAGRATTGFEIVARLSVP